MIIETKTLESQVLETVDPRTLSLDMALRMIADDSHTETELYLHEVTVPHGGE